MNGAGRFRARRPSFTAFSCVIVMTAVLGLAAMSLVFGAPASATNLHGSGSRTHHSSRTPRHDSTDDEASSAIDNSRNEPASVVTWQPGHDKCKRRKGNRPLLPWCTDPAAGWTESTTLRAESVTAPFARSEAITIKSPGGLS